MLHKILVTTIRSIVTVTFVWLFHVALSRKWLLNMAVVLYIANALIGIYSSIASDLLLLYLPKSSSPSVAGLDAAQSCSKFQHKHKRERRQHGVRKAYRV